MLWLWLTVRRACAHASVRVLAVCSVAFLCALLLPFSSFAFCIVCLQPGTRSNMRGETVRLRGSGNVCAVSPEATPRRDESSIIA